MTATTSTSTRTSSTTTPVFVYNDDRLYDANSVTPSKTGSRCFSFSSTSSRGCSEEDDCDADTVCASPSSACSIATHTNQKKLLDCDSYNNEDDSVPARASLALPASTAASTRRRRKASIFQRCYGNADLADRIGRTISLLLVTRVILSVVLTAATTTLNNECNENTETWCEGI